MSRSDFRRWPKEQGGGNGRGEKVFQPFSREKILEEDIPFSEEDFGGGKVAA